MNLAEVAIVVEHANSNRPAILQQEFRGEFELAKFDGLKRLGLQVECASDFPAGGVAMGMQHSVTAMSAFPSEGNLGARAIELGAPLDQFLDARRTFFHQDAGCRFVTQS